MSERKIVKTGDERSDPAPLGQEPGPSEIDQLHAQLAQAQKLKAELEKRNAELEDNAFRFSIERLVKEGIPKLCSNSSKKRHEDEARAADIKVEQSFVTMDDLDSFDVNTVSKDGIPLPSFLMLELKKCPNNFLSSESAAAIRNYVRALILDALESMQCEKSYKVFCDMTIFSLKPDVIVVVHPQLGVVLMVEVKNPREGLFTSKHITGQVYDHLKGMERLGHTTPFVVVASYEEMAFASLEGGKNREYRKVVDESANSLRSQKGHSSSLSAKSEKPAESPQEKSIKNPQGQAWIPQTPKPPEKGECEDNDDADAGQKRETVVYSRVFGRQNELKAMILAIECGIRSLETVDQNLRDYLPAQGGAMEVELPFVTKNCFTWKKCPAPIQYGLFSSIGCEKFYLLSELGRGRRTGKVFLSCDDFGRTCALKFYLEHPDDWESYRKSARQPMAKMELARWNRFYPRFEQCGAVLELNNAIVVKMPYFSPVPPDKRLDKDILSQVKQQLLTFERERLFYAEVRWRHVGCSRGEDGNLVVTMLNLGSLLTEETLSVLDHLKQLVESSGQVATDHGGVSELLNSIP
ncbi:MAG: hypothetical protein SGILL_005420 [Bacillariaceae sp.]